jgi:hypothetical protein
MTARNFGLILVFIGVLLLASPYLKLSTTEHEYVVWPLDWTTKLKAGELFNVWSRDQSQNYIVIQPDGRYSVRFKFTLWNGTAIYSPWLSPSATMYDAKQLNIRMPHQDAWVSMELYRAVNPTPDSVGEFVESYGKMFVVLDGQVQYPLVYEHFIVYSASLENGMLTVDVEAKSDTIVQMYLLKLYGVNMSMYDWHFPQLLDSLAPGRYTRTYTWNYTHLQIEVDGDIIYLTESDFTKPPAQRTPDEQNTITNLQQQTQAQPFQPSTWQLLGIALTTIGAILMLPKKS